MTTYEPRCPALHPGLPYSRCAREKGHGMLHCNASGNTWDYSSDLMDGGVTAARTEQEAERNAVDRERDRWKEVALTAEADLERAETALADVHERDETVARLETRLTVAEGERGWWEAEFWKERKEHAALSRAESHDRIRDAVIETTRPVRAEDITISMCLRAANHFERHRSWEGALLAALTEPQRPEGAEEIEAYMRELVASHPEDHYGELADHLASRGVLPPLTDKTHPEEQS